MELRIAAVRILIDVIDTFGIKGGSTALDPVNFIAFLKEEFDLAANLVVKPGELPEKKAAAPKRVSPAFETLLRSGERLLSLIRKNQGLANKSAARFADEVNALIKKWGD